MPENLQELAKILRGERCPRRVLEAVQLQIARKTRARPLFVFRTAVLAVSLAMALGVVTILRWPKHDDVNRPTPAVVTAPADHVKVAQQAATALEFIGAVLLQTGEHTGNILLNDAVPPLRNGLESASETIKSKL